MSSAFASSEFNSFILSVDKPTYKDLVDASVKIRSDFKSQFPDRDTEDLDQELNRKVNTEVKSRGLTGFNADRLRLEPFQGDPSNRQELEAHEEAQIKRVKDDEAGFLFGTQAEFAIRGQFDTAIRSIDKDVDGDFTLLERIKDNPLGIKGRLVEGAATRLASLSKNPKTLSTVKRFINSNPDGDADFLNQVGEGIGGAGVDIGVVAGSTLLSGGNIAVGGAAGLAFNARTRYADSYRTALAFTGDKELAHANGLSNSRLALIDTAGDLIIGGGIAKAGLRLFGEGSVDAVKSAKTIAERRVAVQNLIREGKLAPIKNIATPVARDISSEVPLEVFTEIASGAITSRILEDGSFLEDAKEGVVMTAVMAAIISGTFGAGEGTLNNFADRKLRKQGQLEILDKAEQLGVSDVSEIIDAKGKLATVEQLDDALARRNIETPIAETSTEALESRSNANLRDSSVHVPSFAGSTAVDIDSQREENANVSENPEDFEGSTKDIEIPETFDSEQEATEFAEANLQEDSFTVDRKDEGEYTVTLNDTETPGTEEVGSTSDTPPNAIETPNTEEDGDNPSDAGGDESQGSEADLPPGDTGIESTEASDGPVDDTADADVVDSIESTEAPTVEVNDSLSDDNVRFLRESVIVEEVEDGDSLENITTESTLAGKVNVGDRRSLSNLTKGDRLYHETNLKSIRSLVPSFNKSKKRHSDIFASDNVDLAQGQGGKGYTLVVDSRLVNGRKPKSLANESSTSGSEFVISKSVKGSLKGVRVSSSKQVESLKRTPGIEKILDFDNLGSEDSKVGDVAKAIFIPVVESSRSDKTNVSPDRPTSDRETPVASPEVAQADASGSGDQLTPRGDIPPREAVQRDLANIDRSKVDVANTSVKERQAIKTNQAKVKNFRATQEGLSKAEVRKKAVADQKKLITSDKAANKRRKIADAEFGDRIVTTFGNSQQANGKDVELLFTRGGKDRPSTDKLLYNSALSNQITEMAHKQFGARAFDTAMDKFVSDANDKLTDFIDSGLRTSSTAGLEADVINDVRSYFREEFMKRTFSYLQAKSGKGKKNSKNSQDTEPSIAELREQIFTTVKLGKSEANPKGSGKVEFIFDNFITNILATRDGLKDRKNERIEGGNKDGSDKQTSSSEVLDAGFSADTGAVNDIVTSIKNIFSKKKDLAELDAGISGPIRRISEALTSGDFEALTEDGSPTRRFLLEVLRAQRLRDVDATKALFKKIDDETDGQFSKSLQSKKFGTEAVESGSFSYKALDAEAISDVIARSPHAEDLRFQDPNIQFLESDSVVLNDLVGDLKILSVEPDIVYFRTDDDTISDGFYDPVSDTMFVNTRRTRPAEFIIAHEAIHALQSQNPELHDALQTSLLENGLRSPSNTQKLRLEEYEKDRRPGDYMADVMARAFLDARSMRTFENRIGNPSLFQKIMRFMSNIVRRVNLKIRDLNTKWLDEGNDQAMDAFADTYRAAHVFEQTLMAAHSSGTYYVNQGLINEFHREAFNLTSQGVNRGAANAFVFQSKKVSNPAKFVRDNVSKLRGLLGGKKPKIQPKPQRTKRAESSPKRKTSQELNNRTLLQDATSSAETIITQGADRINYSEEGLTKPEDYMDDIEIDIFDLPEFAKYKGEISIDLYNELIREISNKDSELSKALGPLIADRAEMHADTFAGSQTQIAHFIHLIFARKIVDTNGDFNQRIRAADKFKGITIHYKSEAGNNDTAQDLYDGSQTMSVYANVNDSKGYKSYFLGDLSVLTQANLELVETAFGAETASVIRNHIESRRKKSFDRTVQDVARSDEAQDVRQAREAVTKIIDKKRSLIKRSINFLRGGSFESKKADTAQNAIAQERDRLIGILDNALEALNNWDPNQSLESALKVDADAQQAIEVAIGTDWDRVLPPSKRTQGAEVKKVLASNARESSDKRSDVAEKANGAADTPENRFLRAKANGLRTSLGNLKSGKTKTELEISKFLRTKTKQFLGGRINSKPQIVREFKQKFGNDIDGRTLTKVLEVELEILAVKSGKKTLQNIEKVSTSLPPAFQILRSLGVGNFADPQNGVEYTPSEIKASANDFNVERVITRLKSLGENFTKIAPQVRIEIDKLVAQPEGSRDYDGLIEKVSELIEKARPEPKKNFGKWLSEKMLDLDFKYGTVAEKKTALRKFLKSRKEDAELDVILTQRFRLVGELATSDVERLTNIAMKRFDEAVVLERERTIEQLQQDVKVKSTDIDTLRRAVTLGLYDMTLQHDATVVEALGKDFQIPVDTVRKFIAIDEKISKLQKSHDFSTAEADQLRKTAIRTTVDEFKKLNKNFRTPVLDALQSSRVANIFSGISTTVGLPIAGGVSAVFDTTVRGFGGVLRHPELRGDFLKGLGDAFGFTNRGSAQNFTFAQSFLNGIRNGLHATGDLDAFNKLDTNIRQGSGQIVEAMNNFSQTLETNRQKSADGTIGVKDHVRFAKDLALLVNGLPTGIFNLMGGVDATLSNAAVKIERESQLHYWIQNDKNLNMEDLKAARDFADQKTAAFNADLSSLNLHESEKRIQSNEFYYSTLFRQLRSDPKEVRKSLINSEILVHGVTGNNRRVVGPFSMAVSIMSDLRTFVDKQNNLIKLPAKVLMFPLLVIPSAASTADMMLNALPFSTTLMKAALNRSQAGIDGAEKGKFNKMLETWESMLDEGKTQRDLQARMVMGSSVAGLVLLGMMLDVEDEEPLLEVTLGYPGDSKERGRWATEGLREYTTYVNLPGGKSFGIDFGRGLLPQLGSSSFVAEKIKRLRDISVNSENASDAVLDVIGEMLGGTALEALDLSLPLVTEMIESDNFRSTKGRAKDFNRFLGSFQPFFSANNNLNAIVNGKEKARNDIFPVSEAFPATMLFSKDKVGAMDSYGTIVSTRRKWVSNLSLPFTMLSKERRTLDTAQNKALARLSESKAPNSTKFDLNRFHGDDFLGTLNDVEVEELLKVNNVKTPSDLLTKYAEIYSKTLFQITNSSWKTTGISNVGGSLQELNASMARLRRSQDIRPNFERAKEMVIIQKNIDKIVSSFRREATAEATDITRINDYKDIAKERALTTK